MTELERRLLKRAKALCLIWKATQSKDDYISRRAADEIIKFIELNWSAIHVGSKSQDRGNVHDRQ